MSNKNMVGCPVCGGDGIETCSNPDHGFIAGMGLYELRCPICGSDPYHKVPNGGKCDFCNGSGEVTEERAAEIENN